MLAYVLAPHEDADSLKLKALLQPFGLTHFYTDAWGAYLRLLDPHRHTVGKANTQKIERQHLTLRTRITNCRSPDSAPATTIKPKRC